MTTLTSLVIAFLILFGSGFALIAAIGLLRFPDLYTRMHAASKAGTLGSGVLLIALAVDSHQLDIITRAVAGFVFLLLTAPLSAHLLARAAYIIGQKPWGKTDTREIDEIGIE